MHNCSDSDRSIRSSDPTYTGIRYPLSVLFHLEVGIVVPTLIRVSDAVIQAILVSGICYQYPCSALDYVSPACNL